MATLVLGLLGRYSGANQSLTLPVSGPGQPLWCYKVIHSFWLPLLGLSVHRKNQAVHQSQLLPALGQGQVSKSPKEHQDLLLPSSCLLGSVTERNPDPGRIWIFAGQGCQEWREGEVPVSLGQNGGSGSAPRHIT